MTAIGLGIVGCGGIANVHADAAMRSGFQLVTCWDSQAERAHALASKHGAAASSSLESLLRHPRVDAVTVAVPTDAHAYCAEAVLASNRHLLLEKPMALTVAECDSICAAAGRSKGRLQMGLVCRSSPAAQHVMGLVRSGSVGPIDFIQARCTRRRGIPGLGGWFTTRSRSGGGCMIDVGVHLIDLALHLAGWPRVLRVSACTASRFGSPIEAYRSPEMWGGPPKVDGTFDVEDSAIALLRCDGGLSIEVDVAWAANIPSGAARDGLLLRGAKAGVHFEIFGAEVRTVADRDGELLDERSPVLLGQSMSGWDAAWDAQYRRFGDVVRGVSEPAATAADGLELQRIIAAIYESAALGRETEVR
ncbi:MAG: gfo/Idh/MocA family oxidoreductase [Planctomycetes bacterium]|nr:gfo/Idh/MocA family oxidoreductase [Planctomycetota bacterium]